MLVSLSVRPYLTYKYEKYDWGAKVSKNRESPAAWAQGRQETQLPRLIRYVLAA